VRGGGGVGGGYWRLVDARDRGLDVWRPAVEGATEERHERRIVDKGMDMSGVCKYLYGVNASRPKIHHPPRSLDLPHISATNNPQHLLSWK
jgi:hypothetical protein